MIGVYSGESLKTMEKIMDNVRSYYPNQTYKNNQYNIYWFINSKGYLHVLRPATEKLNGRIVNYTIKDFMLTKDNMLKDKGVLYRFSTIEEVYNKMEELINE
jgi:hypothetical protein